MKINIEFLDNIKIESITAAIAREVGLDNFSVEKIEKMFEEDYPSLKGLESNPNDLLFSERNGYTKLYNERAIRNTCIDKVKVYTVVSKLYNTDVRDSLMKKLGLEK